MKNLCKRCSRCCEYLMLTLSKEDLKEQYLGWYKSKIKDCIEDIFLIYPMLRYIKFDKKLKRHIYKCVHLKKDKNNKGMCEIHGIRPKMCSGFPSYRSTQMCLNRNPSQYIGCGYNIDKTIGEK